MKHLILIEILRGNSPSSYELVSLVISQYAASPNEQPWYLDIVIYNNNANRITTKKRFVNN